MKKTLIGIYLFIIIGIVAVLGTSHFFTNKDSKEIALGASLYNKQCAACHGNTGLGEGAKIGTAINNQNFLNTVSDKDLYNVIKYGRQEDSMPAYGPRLAEKDLKNLVAFIRNWQTQNIHFTVPKSITGDPANGDKLYNLYCATCHGKAGAGKLRMGPSLANPNYLKYTTDKQIWISTAYGREKTSMGPSLKGLDGVRQLKKSDISDIVSYMESLKKK